MNLSRSSQAYKINKKRENVYMFLTSREIEYQFFIKNSGIVYKNFKLEEKSILELSLKCTTISPQKDSATITTIVEFVNEFLLLYDAIYLQTHNQLEGNRGREERRGVSRVNLWKRISSIYFPDHILLTNLDENKAIQKDIPCLLIKKDIIDFNQMVSGFYNYINTEF